MTTKNDIEQLFREHFAQMHRLAVALLHDDDLAADIVQDVFASLLEREASVIVSGGYLMNAVRNRCLNYIRDLDIHRRIAAAYFLDNEKYDAGAQPDSEDTARLPGLIASELSPQARRVIQLRFYRGLPFADVAAEMGISQTAVFRHLRHALIAIRQKLKKNG